MTRKFLIIAAILGFLGVGLGAFGAHSLEATLEKHDRVDTFQTASEYQMYHVFAIIAAVWLHTRLQGEDQRWARRAAWLFITGIIIFSGSLYILAIFNLRFMGAIAPIGGTTFLLGWGCLGRAGAALRE